MCASTTSPWFPVRHAPRTNTSFLKMLLFVSSLIISRSNAFLSIDRRRTVSSSSIVRRAIQKTSTPVTLHGRTQNDRQRRRHFISPFTKEHQRQKSLLLSSSSSSSDDVSTISLGGLFGRLMDKKTSGTSTNGEMKRTVVEEYFDAWNRRDMSTAISLFSPDCIYEDTQYSSPFTGRDALKKHLLKVANALPPSFVFIIDDIAVSSPGKEDDGIIKVGVQWHVENKKSLNDDNDDDSDRAGGTPLPFARGCSFYTIDPTTNLIQTGFDVPEPAVIKPGGVGLAILSIAGKILDEPVRLVPSIVWIAYVVVVFFSNGILPGADATQLEPRTWMEVRDLSLNFFLVAPSLHLPFSPVVHPGLEGIFNLLLSWAGMFAGFLSDDGGREEKVNNVLPMVPVVVGMQFLTSAFLLPYLVTRTSETLEEEGGRGVVFVEDLGVVERVVGESRVLGPLLGGVGVMSLFWGFFGRFDEFGGLAERYASLVDLLSIDRVGSSFVVDLVIFGLFQGWLVDDDLKRRGVAEDEMLLLRGVAKFVPFFGLALYLTLRPELPSRESGEAEML